MIVRAVAELPPGMGRAFVFNNGQAFGVVLHENPARGVALVLMQDKSSGNVDLAAVARGADAVAPYLVIS